MTVRRRRIFGALACLALAASSARAGTPWEDANPLQPLPRPPLGLQSTFAELPTPPTPARVRLGRWLFYDTRLSGDGSLSCASCHLPEHAFSQPTPVSTGVHGQRGVRKAPPLVNLAWTIYPNFFWDGRASSLEAQALAPIANPIEMGGSHGAMVKTLAAVRGYRPYFKEAFGSDRITKERVAHAIADYERTRLSGNSPVDRWRVGRDESAVSAEVKQGYALFFGKAECNQCHLGESYTDGRFHNLGIGWDAASRSFADPGRHAITKRDADRGAFKTPGLREVAQHAPYMHDGSIATLGEVVRHYDRGGIANPWLTTRVRKLDLTAEEVRALVAFMEALSGEGYADRAPIAFPQ
jgi:cytochrome c peroxidase